MEGEKFSSSLNNILDFFFLHRQKSLRIIGIIFEIFEIFKY